MDCQFTHRMLLDYPPDHVTQAINYDQAVESFFLSEEFREAFDRVEKTDKTSPFPLEIIAQNLVFFEKLEEIFEIARKITDQEFQVEFLYSIAKSMADVGLFGRAVELLEKLPFIEGRVKKKREETFRHVSLGMANAGIFVEAFNLAEKLPPSSEKEFLLKTISGLRNEQTSQRNNPSED